MRWFAIFVAALSAVCGSSLCAAEGPARALFNGHDLAGWDGDPRFWSVQDGCIRGQTTLAAPPVRNTFLIWRGGMLRDFELQLKVRIQNGNSGVQYRSRDLGRWVVSGYQAEVENKPGKAGFLYEEKGRGWLARVGEKAAAGTDGKLRVIGAVADPKALVAQHYYRMRDWNDYRIVARGGRVQHWVNGVPTIDFTDEDPARRSLEGMLALQIHAGPPMIVEFRDILLKTL